MKAILIAPVSTEKLKEADSDFAITANTCRADDTVVPIEHSILFYRACIKQNVPAQMHLYPEGGHGFGLKNNKTKDEWSERLACWLDELK